MAVHFIDSVVFQDSVGTERMRKVFDETTMFQRWLDVEGAIALAAGDLGMIPKSAAARIADCARVEKIDLETVKAHGKVTTHSLIGLLKEFRRAINHEDARYVHWGATTQDIIDTAMMLMIRDAYDIVEELLTDTLRHGRPLLATHRDTLMVGRTHGGHALPITFGLKAAIWLDELVRQLQRWRAARERILVVNIIGPLRDVSADSARPDSGQAGSHWHWHRTDLRQSIARAEDAVDDGMMERRPRTSPPTRAAATATARAWKTEVQAKRSPR